MVRIDPCSISESVCREGLGVFAQDRSLGAGRDEDTNHFLFTSIVLSHAHVHPAVFRFARRKVSSKNGFTVLRGNDHVGGTATGRRNSSHTLDGRAVFVVTALVRIPVMSAACGTAGAQ